MYKDKETKKVTNVTRKQNEMKESEIERMIMVNDRSTIDELEKTMCGRLFLSRVKSNYSVEDTAEYMNVPPAQVRAWERGRTPWRERINLLANFYNVKPGYLSYGDDIQASLDESSPSVDKEDTEVRDDEITHEDVVFNHCYSFADRFKALLNNRGIDVKKLSLFSTIPENTLQGYLQGAGSDVLAHIMLISDVLGIDRCRIAFGGKR